MVRGEFDWKANRHEQPHRARKLSAKWYGFVFITYSWRCVRLKRSREKERGWWNITYENIKTKTTCLCVYVNFTI